MIANAINDTEIGLTDSFPLPRLSYFVTPRPHFLLPVLGQHVMQFLSLEGAGVEPKAGAAQ
jgi:hypothetical protein